MLRTTVPAALLSVSLVAALTGCGGETKPSAGPTGSPAEIKLSKTVADLGDADQIEYLLQVTATGDTQAYIAQNGRYSTKDRSFEQTAAVPSKAGANTTVLQRIVGTDGFMQMEAWGAPVNKCWLKLPVDDLAQVAGVTPEQFTGAPTVLRVLRSIKQVVDVKDGQGTAAVPLKDALFLFPGDLGAASALPGVKGTVDVTISSAGAVVKLLAKGPDLAAALKELDLAVPTGLAAADMRFDIKDDSKGTPIEAPATNLQMSSDDLQLDRCPVS